MTVAEVARLLEVSPFTVYKLCERGLLAHHRVGTRRGCIRIEAADIDAYRSSRRVEARPAEEAPENPRGPRRGSRPAIPDIIGEELARRRRR
jgi:excisionase family DNA binding protein